MTAIAQLVSFIGGLNPVHVLLCAVIFLVSLWWYRGSKDLPPGPWGVPVLGLLPRVFLELRRGSHPHLLFAEYAKRYGPVFRARVVNKMLVVLNDHESVKQAFLNPNLSDRPPNTLIAEAMKSEGVAMASGEPWKDLRRFSLTVLRSLGVGKSSFEEQIGQEAKALVEEMTSYDGKPFDPKYLFGNAVGNVICSAVLGKRYEYSDEEFTHLMHVIHKIVNYIGSGGLLNAVPVMRVFQRNKTDVYASFGEFRSFLLSVIASHQSEMDPENPRDFIDVFLNEIDTNEKAASNGSVKANGSVRTNGFTPGKANPPNGLPPTRHPYLTNKNIVGTIANLFAAGMETTATTLHWALLYMAVYPEIQQRVQAEIDAVVGRNRLPRMADKQELNFTQAVMLEVQRIAVVTPFGFPHAAAADTELMGFRIPKGSLLVSNFWALFRDPKVWPEPDKFKPERFLDKDGLAFKPEELIPFSTGRRSCIGEHLAKMELFVFFSFFLHQFTFKKPDDAPPYTFESRVGLTRYPVQYQICAIQRN
ncbi:cytochrome P450 2J6-like [Patiria miniata]|uniref:Cytochrome P450 n=1 Tax=Patiria miniata TaxID=46514 RepID=A0A914A7I7_PATMI|nr:cytochrome P450 2J6-like [Patiria miniata]